MPVLLRLGGFVFEMVMYDCQERKHVHVKGNGSGGAKVWLEPVEVESPGRYNAHELSSILAIIGDQRSILIERWNAECARTTARGTRS